MNLCGGMTDDEIRRLTQARLEGAESFRFTLGMIHFSRVSHWQSRVQEERDMLKSIPEERRAELLKKIAEDTNTQEGFIVAYRKIMGFPDSKDTLKKK